MGYIGRLSSDEFIQATGPYHDGEHRLLGRMLYNRQQAVYARPSGIVMDYVNMPGATTTPEGTGTNADDSTGPYVRWTTSTTINTDAGQPFTPATVFGRASWGAEFRANIKIGATLTNARYFVGLFSADPMASADPAVHAAAFRYDTVADGTAFWRLYSNDGTTTGLVTPLTATIQRGVGTIVASQRYDLRIKIEALQGAAPNKIVFFINDKLVGFHSYELPGATTYIMPWAQVRCLAASAARTIDINQIILNTQPIA
jgi:hypothetical protein